METINKNKAKVVVIYVIHLAVFLWISTLMIKEMTIVENALAKLDKNYIVTSYNHVYLSLFYCILSTYYLVKNLNLKINKILKVLVYMFSLLFFFIALFKYYSLYNFVKIVIVSNGLLISINQISRRIVEK